VDVDQQAAVRPPDVRPSVDDDPDLSASQLRSGEPAGAVAPLPEPLPALPGVRNFLVLRRLRFGADLRRVHAEQPDGVRGPVPVPDLHRVAVDDLDDGDGMDALGGHVPRGGVRTVADGAGRPDAGTPRRQREDTEEKRRRPSVHCTTVSLPAQEGFGVGIGGSTTQPERLPAPLRPGVEPFPPQVRRDQ